MTLATNYLGLVLKNPLVASSSPLSHTVDSIRRLEDAGASAVVMYSLFEEQITFDSHYVDHYLRSNTNSFAESLDFFPEMSEYNVWPDEYLNLIRRAKEGGSYHVRVNLARCAMWFMSLGKFDKNAPAPTGEQHQILVPETITAQTPYGELVRLAPPVKFSETKPYWEDPVLVVRGSSKAQWKDS